MASQSRVGNGFLRRRPASQRGRRGHSAAISARHQQISDRWAADVDYLERAIDGFETDRNLTNNCQVVFFEIVGDTQLHCNVTHRYETRTVSGWAGPAHLADGFVHNRRFGATSQNVLIRHIRNMVLASQV